MNQDYNLRQKRKPNYYPDYDIGQKRPRSKLKTASSSNSKRNKGQTIQAPTPSVTTHTASLIQITDGARALPEVTAPLIPTAEATTSVQGNTTAASTPEAGMASTVEGKLDLILKQMQNMEQRVNNIEDNIGDRRNTGQASASGAAPSGGASSNVNVNQQVHQVQVHAQDHQYVVSLTDEEDEDTDDGMSVVSAASNRHEYYPPPRRSGGGRQYYDNGRHQYHHQNGGRHAPYDRRGQRYDNYEDRGRGGRQRSSSRGRSHTPHHSNQPRGGRRHSQTDQPVSINSRQDRPRRSSTPGTGSTMTEAMRKEIVGIVNNTLSANKAHEELANHQVIISGVPRLDHDGTPEALKLLQTIHPALKESDIDNISRFPMATEDGTHPMIVTFVDPQVANIIITKAEANKAAFPWFQRSLARYIRRWNAKMEREKDSKNANIPDTDPTIWETKVVGVMKILRRCPNPKYVPPAMPATTVAGFPAPTPTHQRRTQEQRPMDTGDTPHQP